MGAPSNMWALRRVIADGQRLRGLGCSSCPKPGGMKGLGFDWGGLFGGGGIFGSQSPIVQGLAVRIAGGSGGQYYTSPQGSGIATFPAGAGASPYGTSYVSNPYGTSLFSGINMNTLVMVGGGALALIVLVSALKR